MSQRKKVHVSLPVIAEWILKNSTSQQLSYLSALASKEEFKLLIKVVTDLKHYNVYQVFSKNFKDDHELALFRAAARGEVAGLDALLYVMQGAKLEIEERKRDQS
jgi:hypothetical protein